MGFRTFRHMAVALGVSAAMVVGSGGADALAGPLDGARPASTPAVTGMIPDPGASADPGWFTSWTQSQQRVTGLSPETFKNRSVRIITRLTQGGSSLRVRLQNQFGTAPLVVDATTAGLSAGGAAVEPGTMRSVTFGGSSTVSIPAGGQVWSDPIALTTKPLDDLDVSFYLSGATVMMLHDLAGRTNYFSAENGGDTTADTSGSGFPDTHTWTYLISAVDVQNRSLAGTVVAYGSSVVDGVGGDNCGPGCPARSPYQRWTDTLAQRVTAELPADQQVAVVNEGISGTTATAACQADGLDGVSRLDRDVLALHGVTAVIYYYGTNDLADGCTADAILAAYKETFRRLRDSGIKIFVTPITPRPSYTDAQNASRATVNAFVRSGGDCSGTCDGVLDFDAVLKDPDNPNSINPAYDNGDGIHANIAGQTAIARSIPLSLLAKSGAPRITSIKPVDGRRGRSYRATFTASGHPNPTFSVSAGRLPPGLTLNPANGSLSGTPGRAGAYSFTVTASNSVGRADQPIRMHVVQSPAIASGPPRPGVVGAAYTFALRASGFPAPRFTVARGKLPAGLTLEANGTIVGVPTSAGSYDVTLRADNGVARAAVARYAIAMGKAQSVAAVVDGPARVARGEKTNLDVVVFASGAAPSGAVRVGVGGTVLATSPARQDPDVPGVAHARVVVPAGALKPGKHRLTVTYRGNSNVTGSRSHWVLVAG